MGEWSSSPTILNLGITFMCDQLHTPAVLLSRKDPSVPIGQEAGWPESWCGSCGKKKSFTAGNRTRAGQPVAGRYVERTIPSPKGNRAWTILMYTASNISESVLL
jgi:hypothetical protein